MTLASHAIRRADAASMGPMPSRMAWLVPAPPIWPVPLSVGVPMSVRVAGLVLSLAG